MPALLSSLKPRVRRHGCETPWASAQITAVGIVLLSTAIFYAFSVHELPSELQRMVIVLVSVQLAMVVAVFATISLLDPAHPAVIEHMKQQRSHSMTEATQSPDDSLPDVEGGRSLHGQRSTTTATSNTSRPTAMSLTPDSSPQMTATGSTKRMRIQCALCDVAVSPGTRHCSVCRKCVVGFDHHCVYLNTCIGSRNYPLFIALLTCTIVLVASQLTVTVYAMDLVRRRGDTIRVIVVAGLSVLPLLQLVSMLVLACFHSYISCKGLRTYEWLRRFHERSSRLTAKTPTWPDGRSTPDPLDNDNDPRTRRRIEDRVPSTRAATASPIILAATATADSV